jgi:hypothetical protein
MKGKAEPLPIFAVAGERQQRAIRLQEPTYAAIGHADARRTTRGGCRAHPATDGAVLWPIYRAPFDEALASARATLGEQAFDAAWAAGQAMTLEQAIAAALGEDADLTCV